MFFFWGGGGPNGSHIHFSLSSLSSGRDESVAVSLNSIIMGHNALGIESEVAWATPGVFTTKNYPCNSDGTNCQASMEWQSYVDPSSHLLRGVSTSSIL